MGSEKRNDAESDAVALVNGILSDAVAAEASDVYWIPCADECRIRVRAGGVQRDLRTIRGADFIARCAARIKVLAGMLTYRSKISQDGAIRGGPELDNAEFRVATMPTWHGERITLRLLGRKLVGRTLDDLGFSPEVCRTLRAMLRPPGGLIVLTGPTGCGKTTTIYAMIRELVETQADPSSIITVEDPVETVFPDISQVSLTRSGERWNYPEALMAALRQDVKTLVIGEIRDSQVAHVVLNAALSGHRVITTLHAGDIPGVYARLLHQGLEAFLVASAITGVVSQRLALNATGERRIPVAATLVPDDAWRDFVTAKPALSELRRRIQDYPCADIQAVANRMAANNLIPKREALVI